MRLQHALLVGAAPLLGGCNGALTGNLLLLVAAIGVFAGTLLIDRS